MCVYKTLITLGKCIPSLLCVVDLYLTTVCAEKLIFEVKLLCTNFSIAVVILHIFSIKWPLWEAAYAMPPAKITFKNLSSKPWLLKLESKVLRGFPEKNQWHHCRGWQSKYYYWINMRVFHLTESRWPNHDNDKHY